MPSELRAYLDESSAIRSEDSQEYLVCAAVVPDDSAAELRERLLSLRLKGQIKLHWTDESDARRKKIVAAVSELTPMTAVVTHMSQRQNKTERFRRKCLETIYYELASMGIREVVCEARMPAQNQRDIAHIVALRGQKVVDRDFTISHCRGGDDPLLWIPDIFLGAINAKYAGQDTYYEALKDLLILERRTPDSA
ncbi:hypothetical protein [Arthrobacter sp. Soil762]|uniref:hypothetical protein n=1 Tax=Arthrobacter sp. Soil762 TaxID=1736401 RepID=UPI0006FC9F31|nr:hypothetical protein [Arthrobacter sp. Soil762]KRE72669.1 hypothetical protein ASG77_08360 [Arthrobacter sp. Soil762]